MISSSARQRTMFFWRGRCNGCRTTWSRWSASEARISLLLLNLDRHSRICRTTIMLKPCTGPYPAVACRRTCCIGFCEFQAMLHCYGEGADGGRGSAYRSKRECFPWTACRSATRNDGFRWLFQSVRQIRRHYSSEMRLGLIRFRSKSRNASILPNRRPRRSVNRSGLTDFTTFAEKFLNTYLVAPPKDRIRFL